MDRCQIVKGGREQRKTDQNAVRRADHVPSPAEELFLFGSAVAAIGPSTYLLTASSMNTPTDRHGQTIDHKHLARAENLAQGARDELQSVSALVQPTMKAGDINPTRPVATFAKDTHRTFVMILEILRRSDGAQDDLRIRHLRTHITLVDHALHQRVDQHKNRYNSIGVHWFLLGGDPASIPRILLEEPMAVNEQSR